MGRWLKELTPSEYVKSIYEIDLEKLYRDGKRLILTDLDNTLVPWNNPEVPDTLRNWLKLAESRGFEVCIVSNNRGERVMAFSQAFGIPAIGAAKKPKPRGYVNAMKQFSRTKQETVMVGDQLFTDIRGGNRCGIYTILVRPIEKDEWWGTKITRRIEWFAMRRLKRRGLQVPQ